MELVAELSFKGTVPMEHAREMDWENDDWTEVNYNYRLNFCDEIFYMVENDKIIAHVGLSENQIKTIYVIKEYRRQGVATKIYESLMKIYPVLKSDDAREEPAQIIWEQLMSKYPNEISYNNKKDVFTYSKS